MRVKDLQEFLAQFTTGSDAIKETLCCLLKSIGKLHDVRRMEVHENAQPIIGFKGHTSHRLVLKTQKPSSLILPDKLQKDY